MNPKKALLKRTGAAKMHLVLGLAVLMMMVPTFLYLAGPLRQPLMVEGDRLEDRPCPQCQGTQKDCKRCHGKGVVPHVVPGPLRPTQVVGHIYAPDQSPVSNAKVSLQTSVGPIDLQSDEKGRFGVTLPPGSYSMTLKSAQGELQEQVKVEVLKTPTPADLDLTFPTEDRAYFLQQKK